MPASDTGIMTPEFLADCLHPRELRLSPDGRHVVYTLRRQSNRKGESIVASLWLAEVDKAESARQLTRGTFNDSSPAFSPDGKYISFVSDRESVDKVSVIYVLPLHGNGEAVLLTAGSNRKSIGSHQWSPNSKYVAFTSADETEKKAELQPKVYGRHWEYARLRIVDVESREVTTLVKQDGHVAKFAWDATGDQLAYTVAEGPEYDQLMEAQDICIITVRYKVGYKICRSQTLVNDLIWHRDELLWIAKPPEVLPSATALWGVATNAQHATPEKKSHGERDCARELRLCGDEPVVYIQDGLSDRLELVKSGQIIFEAATDIAPGWDAVVRENACTVAMLDTMSVSCTEICTASAGTDPVQVTSHCAELAALELNKSMAIETQASDGTVVNGIVCMPNSLSMRNGPHPAVVLVHGGPYDRVTHGRDPVFTWTPWLVSLGYVVLLPNYRGGSGHGALYAETVHGDPSRSYDDVITLVQKCIADGLVDAGNVAISGWSQGGYLTYLAVTRDETFHFTAAIAGAGVTDWDTLAMTSDVPGYEAALGGGAPWMRNRDDTQARRASPIWDVEGVKTPLLILHGEDDVRVPVSQALAFHRGMRMRGQECETVLYPREGHGFPKPFEKAHYVHMLQTIRKFLAKHLRVPMVREESKIDR